jgi:hypothetical protein
MEMRMTQSAPFPEALDEAVRVLHTYDHWRFRLGHMPRDTEGVWPNEKAITEGLTLEIRIAPPDAYHPEKPRPVRHLFIVPAATYDRQSWMAWLLARCEDVQRHELCEHFRLEHVDERVERPFAPNHGPGRDPYIVFHYASDEDRRTAFTGVLNPV